MPIAKSIERQLAKIETTLAQQQPQVTEREEWERKRQEEAQAYEEEFWGLVDTILETMEPQYAQAVVDEIQLADRHDIVKARVMQEDCIRNNLSPLTNAVLSLVNRAQKQPEKMEGIPLSMPAPLCRFFQQHGAATFNPPSNPEQRRATRYAWIMGGVACDECNFPIPHLEGNGPRLNQMQREPGESKELPFKRCPVCDGSVSWGHWLGELRFKI